MQQDPSSILERIRKDGIEFLQFQFTDILGVIKTVTVPKNRFEATVSEGVVFDGSSVAGYAQIEESDMRAIPDYSTYTILPDSGGKVARFICDVYTPEGGRGLKGGIRGTCSRRPCRG